MDIDKEKRENKRQYHRQYYAANREKLIEQNREYARTHKEQIAANDRVYRAKNIDKINEAQREYREAHRSEACQRTKEWKATHQEHRKAYLRDNRDKIAETYGKYREKILSLRKHVKLTYGCQHPNCTWQGEWHERMLDFHHLDPSTKSFSLAAAKHPPEGMLEEISKCTILCANCHRMVTFGLWTHADCPPCDVSNITLP